MLFLNSCGDTSDTVSGSDSVVFSVKWQGTFSFDDTPGVKSINCDTAGVSTIEANIYDNKGAQLAGGGPWSCNSHSGEINGSMAGSNRKIVVMGKNSGGNILYQGESAGISIEEGKTTDVGTIKVSPVTGNNDGSDIDMVLIAGGCFDMGDTFGDGFPEEKPVHKVCVDDFYLGVHEVTQGEWKNVMGSNPSSFQNCGDDCPVESVSWNDAQNFIAALNIQTGLTYRLPREAEWEFAAREGGGNFRYSGFSDEGELYKYANFCDRNCEYNWKTGNQDDGYKNISPIGSFKPNSLGLYDMTGNVWEWVQDWYNGSYYSNSPENNPGGPESGSYRVFRGGSWRSGPRYLRAADRNGRAPDDRGGDVGFRLARTF